MTNSIIENNSYYASVQAQTGLLPGGVVRVRSSRFAELGDAVEWLKSFLDTVDVPVYVETIGSKKAPEIAAANDSTCGLCNLPNYGHTSICENGYDK